MSSCAVVASYEQASPWAQALGQGRLLAPPRHARRPAPRSARMYVSARPSPRARNPRALGQARARPLTATVEEWRHGGAPGHEPPHPVWGLHTRSLGHQQPLHALAFLQAGSADPQSGHSPPPPDASSASRRSPQVPAPEGENDWKVQRAKRHALKLIQTFPHTLKYHLTEDESPSCVAVGYGQQATEPCGGDPSAQDRIPLLTSCDGTNASTQQVRALTCAERSVEMPHSS